MRLKRALWLLSLLAACSGPAEQKASDPIALVRLAKVESGPVRETVEIYGTADPGSAGRIVLSAPEEAVIAAIEVAAGSGVARGQVVARLAPSAAARLELARAATEARAAQLAYARAQRLRADGLVSNAEVDSARAAAQSARATQASLSQRAAALTLRSPAAGHVESVAAGPGSVAATGTAIVTIVPSGDVRARFGVDAGLARRVSPGTSVQVAPSGGGTRFTLPVLAVDPAVDAQTRLASLFVRLPAAAGIGPGEPLSGTLVLARAGSEAPTIPYSGLLDEGGQPFVYVIVAGHAHRRDVRPGPPSGDRVPILQGLRPGELVVVEGGTALEDGMRVRTR